MYVDGDDSYGTLTSMSKLFLLALGCLLAWPRTNEQIVSKGHLFFLLCRTYIYIYTCICIHTSVYKAFSFLDVYYVDVIFSRYI